MTIGGAGETRGGGGCPSALTDFTNAITLEPDNGENYRGRAEVHFSLKDYDSVIEDVTRAFELNPDNGENYFLAGLGAFLAEGL